MNKVYQVNIGGYPFTIDEDAFQILEKYLEALKKHFRYDEGNEEIILDIENRIAELLNESVGNRKIVQKNDVESMIRIMGTLEDFGANPSNEETTSDKKQQSEEEPFKFRPGKRLYKNPEEKIIGGVASGVAAYFGIKDPTWVRLAFVLLVVFGGGTGIPLYIVLMFVLKDAKTPKEKLEMRGEPINLNSLDKIFQKEVKHFSAQMKDFGKKPKTASASFSKHDGPETEAAMEEDFVRHEGQNDPENWQSKIEDWVKELGSSLEYGLKGLQKVITPLLMAVGGIIIAVLVIAWIAIVMSLIIGKPIIMMVMPSDHLVSTLGIINVFLLLLLPLLGIIILFVRLFFKTKIKSQVSAGIFGFWLLNVISLAIVGTLTAQEFSTPFTTVQNLLKKEDQPKRLNLGAIKQSQTGNYQFGSLAFGSGKILMTPVKVTLDKSEDEHFHLIQETSSRGSDENEAKSNLNSMVIDSKVTGDSLFIMDRLVISKDSRFRKQELSYTLRVPENKEVSFSADLGKLILTSKLPGPKIYRSALEGKTLLMTRDSFSILE